jgi:hypothetical protein
MKKMPVLVAALLIHSILSADTNQIRKIENAVRLLESHVESMKNETNGKRRQKKETASVLELDSLLTVVKAEISKDTNSAKLVYLKGKIFHAHAGTFPNVHFFGDSAQAMYKKAISLDADNFDSHLGLGNLYSSSHETMPEAISEFRLAIACDSISARKECHLGLAYAYLMLGKSGLAEREIKEHKKWNGGNKRTDEIEKRIRLRSK